MLKTRDERMRKAWRPLSAGLLAALLWMLPYGSSPLSESAPLAAEAYLAGGAMPDESGEPFDWSGYVLVERFGASGDGRMVVAVRRHRNLATRPIVQWWRNPVRPWGWLYGRDELSTEMSLGPLIEVGSVPPGTTGLGGRCAYFNENCGVYIFTTGRGREVLEIVVSPEAPWSATPGEAVATARVAWQAMGLTSAPRSR